ncbi:ATP-binding protein [Candidatus Woesearchaeota archaeon]|nr:ATP-binding protein [Candidatus Woesearchaeota archaeon]
MEKSEFKAKLLEKEDCFPEIIGQEDAKKQLKSALLSERHLIIVGPSGIGKTTLAKNVAKLLPTITVNDCAYNCLPEKPICPECREGKTQKTKQSAGEERFVRLQGSPDLTSEDLLGDIDPVKAMKHGTTSIISFKPGKIFHANNGVLFFDELNRCPEKVQNALLQVLEESRATIGSYTIDLETNFIFIGTINKQDTSTEQLSDVFMDRLDVVYMSYPESPETEERIMLEKSTHLTDVPQKLAKTIIRFIRQLREDKRLEKLPSVRATIGLYERAQSNALLNGRHEANLEDLKEAVTSVLAHRIELKPSAKYLLTPEQLLNDELEEFLKKGDYR